MTQPSEHHVSRQAERTHAVAQPGREEGYITPDSHPVEHERPEDWGWHGETGKWGRIGAWFTVLIILAYLLGNHEGRTEDLWVVGIAGLIAGILIWDHFRRRNAWRSR